MRITRQLLCTGFAFILIASVACAQSVEPLINGLNGRDLFNLSWSDEFNGSSLDATKWGHEFAGKRWDATLVPEAVTVGGGNMTLRTYSEWANGAYRHYTGTISTRDKFTQAYGYYEARIDFDSSPGTWSAFWVHSARMTGNLPPDQINRPDIIGAEIDVVEHRRVDQYGTDYSSGAYHATHWNGYGSTQQSTGNMNWNYNVGTGYHTYGLLWARDRYEFYIDGNKSWTVTNPNAISSIKQFLILGTEVQGGGWAGALPASGYGTLASTSSMVKVDYVRVFTFNQDSIVIPEPTSLISILAASLSVRRRRR